MLDQPGESLQGKPAPGKSNGRRSVLLRSESGDKGCGSFYSAASIPQVELRASLAVPSLLCPGRGQLYHLPGLRRV